MTLAHLFVHVKRHVRALHTFHGDSIDFVCDGVYLDGLSLLCSTHITNCGYRSLFIHHLTHSEVIG